jgi:hypothetical protein
MADDPEDYHPRAKTRSRMAARSVGIRRVTTPLHPPDRRPTRISEPGEPLEIRVGLYCAVRPVRSFSPSGRSSPVGETCR